MGSELAGKVAIVTGGASGIGRASVAALLGAGATPWCEYSFRGSIRLSHHGGATPSWWLGLARRASEGPARSIS